MRKLGEKKRKKGQIAFKKHRLKRNTIEETMKEN